MIFRPKLSILSHRYYVCLALLLFSVGLAGCEKDTECEGQGHCIVVRGRVGSEHNSAVPLKGAVIKLSSIGNGSGFFSEPERVIDYVSSDENGYYSIQFVPTAEMEKRGNYRLLFFKEGYGTGGVLAAAENLTLMPGSSYEKNLHLPRVGGRLRLLITGFPGRSDSNSTYTNVYSGHGARGYLGYGSDHSLFATGTMDIAGSSNITDVTCETAANQYAFVRIYKMKAGIRTAIIDSIYCPVNTPVTYTHQF